MQKHGVIIINFLITLGSIDPERLKTLIKIIFGSYWSGPEKRKTEKNDDNEEINQ